MNRLADFHFLEPAWLLALIPLALLLWLAWRTQAGTSAWRRVIDPRLLAVLSVGGAGGGRRWPLALLAAGWVIAVIALANPTIERKPVPAFRTDAARVVVLDLSRSMLASDLTPTRLERARYKVEDILAADGEAQVGLIAFAGEPFTVVPLTDDAETIRNMLDALSPDLMPVQGSRPDLAIGQARDLLQQAGARNGEVVLLTDDAGDGRAIAAAEALRKAGHRLAVIGVGTEAGAPVPGVRRADGPVIAKLDPTSLRRLAMAGGGAYAPLSTGSADLNAVLGEPGSRAARLDEKPQRAEVWKPLGPWIALALLPFGALAFRRGWLLVLLLAALPATVMTPRPALAVGWDDLWQRRDQQAQQALTAGDHARARDLAEDPARRGSALYRLGDYAAAADAFAAGDTAEDHYNRGNALARAGELKQALDAYDEALRRDPDLEDAADNRARVEEALRRQQARQQEQSGQENRGQQGQQGQQGDQGQQGQQGDQGQQGQQGDQGQQGQQGDQGQQGNQGQQGQQGDQDRQQAQGGQDGAGQSGQQPRDAGQDQSQPRAGQGQDQRDEAQDANGAGGDGEDSGHPDATMAEDQTPEAGSGGERSDTGADDTAAAEARDTARDEEAAAAYRQAAEAAAANRSGDETEGAGAAAAAAQLSAEEREARRAAEQWLRRIPDDPAGLLRRKFQYQYQQRTDAGAEVRAGNPW